MRKLLHFHTGQIVSGRQFTVTVGDSMDGQLTIRHKAYQRFLDIKRRVTDKAGRIRKRSIPIHNRYIHGHYQSIARRLMFEMTDDVVQGIKKDLKIK